MGTKNLIVLSETDGLISDILPKFDEVDEFRVVKSKISELKGEELINWLPGVFISTDVKDTLTFMSKLRTIISKSKSKFIFIAEEDLPPPINKKLEALGITDIITGKNYNGKTVLYKLNLQLKALLDLSDEVMEDLKLKTLKALPKEEKKKKEEVIDFDSVDYLAVNKFCDSTLNLINDTEVHLEDFEDDFDKELIKSSIEAFLTIKKEADALELPVFGDFMEVPKFIGTKILEGTDETFMSVQSGILLNTLDLLRTELKQIKEKSTKKIIQESPHAGLIERYFWLAGKYMEILKDDGLQELLQSLEFEVKA